MPVSRLREFEDWAARPAGTFVMDIMAAFETHEAFRHPLYAQLALGGGEDHRGLCFHAVMLWRMSKLARVQLTQMSLVHAGELTSTSISLVLALEALARKQMSLSLAAADAIARVIGVLETDYGATPLPTLLQVVESDTAKRFFDRVNVACWSERLGWAVASDFSWHHGAPVVAAALSHLNLNLAAADNPFATPDRYLLPVHVGVETLVAQLSTVSRRAAFIRGVLARNDFHRDIWDSFATKFAATQNQPWSNAA
jgi:hypothetical protein